MKENDVIDALKYAVERWDKEVSECIEKKKNGKDLEEKQYYSYVVDGMYFAIDSLNNSLFAFFGDDTLSKTVGTEDLVKKIENSWKKHKSE